MKLGYVAIDQYGQLERLLKPEHPRKQLLEKLGCTYATKMYCDQKQGPPKQRGYVVSGRWFTLYEIHSWEGSAP